MSTTRAASRKRAREEENYPSPKRSRITQWLADTLPGPTSCSHRRTRSAPDRFTGHADLQLCHPQGGTLDDMESELAANDGSSTSDKKSRKSVANSIGALEEHNIFIDPSGRIVPAALKRFLDNNILDKTNTKANLVSEQDHRHIIDRYDALAEANEILVSRLCTRLFPPLLDGLGEDGESVWDTTVLLPESGLPCTLVAPKPDFYVGYAVRSSLKIFDKLQKELIKHAVSQPYASPPKKHYFPFLVVEVKSDPAGGSLFKADCQAAASGAACVKGLRWFFNIAKKTQEPADMEKKKSPELENVEEKTSPELAVVGFEKKKLQEFEATEKKLQELGDVMEKKPQELDSVEKKAQQPACTEKKTSPELSPAVVEKKEPHELDELEKKVQELADMEKTIAFSITMNHRIINLHVHWYDATESQIVMSLVDVFRIMKIEDVRQFAALSNIYEWAMSIRKNTICSMLRSLCRSPPDWMSKKRDAPNDQQGKSKRQKTSKSNASRSAASASVKDQPTKLMSPPRSQAAASLAQS